MLTILEGSTFCMSDERGDIADATSGFFAHDTRFLSRLVLSVQGSPLLLLSSGRVEHFAAAFFLRNASLNGLPQDALSISRERFVGTGMQERIAIRNESMHRLDFEVSLELAADFADIISVKLHDFALGDPENAPDLPAARALDVRRRPPPDPDRRPGGRPEDPHRPLAGRVGSTKAERPSTSRSIRTSAGISPSTSCPRSTPRRTRSSRSI